MKTAVIIAGGRGERLKPLTDDMPKTLVEINGKPVLGWIIKWLVHHRIKNLVIGVAYKKEMIYSYMKQNNYFGINVKFSEHSVEGGTAEGFKKAMRFVEDDDFIAMNSDELTNMDLSGLWNKHIESRLPVTMALTYYNARLSVAKTDNSGKITSFEYGHKIKEVLVSIGIYVFNKSIYMDIPDCGSIENTLFVKLAREGKLGSFLLSEDEEWITINNQKELSEASKVLRQWEEVS